VTNIEKNKCYKMLELLKNENLLAKLANKRFLFAI